MGLDVFGQVIRNHATVGEALAQLEAARAAWLDGKTAEHRRFHHISTDEVYGTLRRNDPPFTETTPYAPNSPILRRAAWR